MNLKKIILEEVDDFEWARDIEPGIHPKVGDRFIWKGYEYGSEEIIIKRIDYSHGEGKEYLYFNSVKPNEDEENDDAMFIETLRIAMNNGTVTPIYE